MRERKIIRAIVKHEIEENYSHREIKDKFGKTGQYKLSIEHIINIINAVQIKRVMVEDD